jgi:hypothetical protein
MAANIAKKKLSKVVSQKDYREWSFANMDTSFDEAQVKLDLNASFRYGLATESEIGLPANKKILVPVFVKNPTNDSMTAMYSEVCTCSGRFAIKTKDEWLKPAAAGISANYDAIWNVAVSHAQRAEVKEVDLGNQRKLTTDTLIDPTAYSNLTLLCLRLNLAQFELNYPSLNYAVIAAGAHAVALAYRNGLIETFAAREFYFVGVQQESDGQFSINWLDPEYVLCGNRAFKLGDRIAKDTMRYDSVLSQVGLGLVIGAGASHYTMNHTTGGREMTGQNARALVINGLYNTAPAHAEASLEEQTNFYYNVLHPVNKRGIACLVIHNSHVYTWYKSVHMPCPSVLYADAFMNYRTKLTPAGCHKIYVALLALKAISEANLYVFLPDIELAKKVMRLYHELNVAGARGHLGSFYYTDEAPSVIQSEVDDFLPIAAFFVSKRMPASSLAGSPHLSLSKADECPDRWKWIVTQTLKIGAAGASDVSIENYLRQCGEESYTADLSTDSGRDSAIAFGKVQLKAILGLLGLGEH